MAKIPFVDFAAVKAAVQIKQVLDHYGITPTLKRSGNGDSLTGPCPIHKGTNPTQFRVSLSKNCWHCFSDCQTGGNILDLVARMEGVGVREAAALLNDWFHVGATTERAPTRSRAAASKPQPPPAPNRAEASPEVVDSEEPPETEAPGVNPPLGFTLQHLESDHPYLAERGLQPDTVQEFGLGLCKRGSMAGRIVVPVHNTHGELVAYVGRWPGEPPDGRPKYKFPTGFKKSAELFNLHRAITEPVEGPLIVVEGVFDALHLWQLGARRVVALMGCLLSGPQKELILNQTLPTTPVLLMFDEDEAGRLGREQALLSLGAHRFVRVHAFPEEGQQPESLTAEAVQHLIGG